MMTIVINVLSLLLSLFMGILLYTGITVLIIGTIFVLREALLLYTDVDLYEVMKSWKPKKVNKPTKKRVVLNEESDKEWLKNRGRY